MPVLRLFSILSLLLAAPLAAKRLPIRTFTVADGLARNHITCIVQDSKGFVWFCTPEGLSRFDGYQFTNYGTWQGLPSNATGNLVETRDGAYWLTAGRSVCRFDPLAGPSRFQCYTFSWKNLALPPLALALDPDGGIWCGTAGGLYRLRPGAKEFDRLDIQMTDGLVTGLLFDRGGRLWIGSPAGLYRREAAGTIAKVDPTGQACSACGLPKAYIMTLMQDRAGTIWVGTREGLISIGSSGGIRILNTIDGLPAPRIEGLLETSEGTLWVSTTAGLAERRAGESKFHAYSVENGLSAIAVGPLAEDRDGNLWIGSFGSGAMKMARSGFTTFSEVDGLRQVASIFETRYGELGTITRGPKGTEWAWFDGAKFVPIRPVWPAHFRNFGWQRGRLFEQDHLGDWWIPTGHGLARFAGAGRLEALRGATPKTVYTSRDGLPSDEVVIAFEDSKGDIWVGTSGLGKGDAVARWSRSTGRFQVFGAADGLLSPPAATGFVEDRAGGLWISSYHNRLLRYRGGRFDLYAEAEGLGGFIFDEFLDSKGRLWLATSRGLVRLEDPGRDKPHFLKYTTREGLSSDSVFAVTEDRFGRIYAATGRGIDRFEPRPEGPVGIRHYTTADGIAPAELDLALCDKRGTLWFSTPLGMSQLTPVAERPRAAPPVLITALSAGGTPLPLSDVGQTSVVGLQLPQRSPLRIDFVGLGFAPGEALRYQYKLESADHDWSAPDDHRSVLYGSLPAGSYRFLVRAVASEGSMSAQPASVDFRVLPPYWRTWWFLGACVASALLIGFGLHQYRLRQMLAVANLRTSIATDLHDDIGASLSQIAVLSEVAQQSPSGGQLTEIAGIARELIDSMNDIVWAINPDHDRLSNLVYRMRRFATDLLGGRKIALRFQSSVTDVDWKVGADVRRQVYLIFKEGIHNIVRHSGATEVQVDLDRQGDDLILRLRDNGRGFDARKRYDGRGLMNMRKRAAALGGKVDWDSAAGEGTLLTLTVRLDSSSPLAMLRGQ